MDAFYDTQVTVFPSLLYTALLLCVFRCANGISVAFLAQFVSVCVTERERERERERDREREREREIFIPMFFCCSVSHLCSTFFVIL